MRIGQDGKLYAVNPEAGFFGVAPGTSFESNPYAMQTISKNTIFTNVALTQEGDVWWEGMTRTPPQGLTDWMGKPWQEGTLAAHPNSRFTVSAAQCPILDEKATAPEGVPISAILFGGRRSSTVPLVYQAFSWAHGVFMGAGVSSETTAAAAGTVGKLRHDPFAMLPFCGYHMGDYFAHWLAIGQKISLQNRPSIFYVNWFRKDQDGKYLWPGFGENIRILKWIFEQTEESSSSIASPIGLVPSQGSIDLTGLELPCLDRLFDISPKEWLEDAKELEEYFSLFGSKMPNALIQELQSLKQRLKTSE
jgi:phosphoenolpyruvate carboxykinase (GTP)